MSWVRNTNFSLPSKIEIALTNYLFFIGGPPLVDEYWHVTDYYNNIREKVKNLDKNLGECYKNIALPDRVCNTPMKVRIVLNCDGS
jgi:hypothetical protein